MAVKLISHTGECLHDDDPTMPFRLELIMRAPSFMNFAFVSLHGGTEDVVARGNTYEELVAWMKQHGLNYHPRLSRYRIVGPEGTAVSEHRWSA